MMFLKRVREIVSPWLQRLAVGVGAGLFFFALNLIARTSVSADGFEGMKAVFLAFVAGCLFGQPFLATIKKLWKGTGP